MPSKPVRRSSEARLLATDQKPCINQTVWSFQYTFSSQHTSDVGMEWGFKIRLCVCPCVWPLWSCVRRQSEETLPSIQTKSPTNVNWSTLIFQFCFSQLLCKCCYFQFITLYFLSCEKAQMFYCLPQNIKFKSFIAYWTELFQLISNWATIFQLFA